MIEFKSKYCSREAIDWLLKPDSYYFDNNYLPYQPKVKSGNPLPSSSIFLKAIEHINFCTDLNLDVSRFKTHRKPKSVLWAIRKDLEKYSVEYYFFYPKKYSENRLENLWPLFKEYNKEIREFDLQEDYYLVSINPEKGFIDGFEFYTSIYNGERSVEFFDTGLLLDKQFPTLQCSKYFFNTAVIQKVNTYFSYQSIKQLHEIISKLIQLCKSTFISQDATIALDFLKLPYIFNDNVLLHPSALKLKENKTIGMYFGDVGFSSFIQFLKFHEYQEKFISDLVLMKDSIVHLRFEIGLDFAIENNKFNIKKTIFWGVI